MLLSRKVVVVNKYQEKAESVTLSHLKDFIGEVVEDAHQVDREDECQLQSDTVKTTERAFKMVRSLLYDLIGTLAGQRELVDKMNDQMEKIATL